MATLVPLNNANAIERLRKAGVEEVYVGFHDEGWEKRFGKSEINRMSGFGAEANPFDFAQMCVQLARARDAGMRAYVCFNSSSYMPDQIGFISENYLEAIAASGGQGVILSGAALVGDARTAGLDAVISTARGHFFF